MRVIKRYLGGNRTMKNSQNALPLRDSRQNRRDRALLLKYRSTAYVRFKNVYTREQTLSNNNNNQPTYAGNKKPPNGGTRPNPLKWFGSPTEKLRVAQ